MNEQQLMRYSRHILLPDLDYEGQQKICDSTCLIIGLGGLGSPVSLYLASSGVSRLLLCDFDVVDESNLQRQIVHNQQTVKMNKAESAKVQLQVLNPTIQIEAFGSKLNEQELTELAKQCDVIIDCTDNFDTRYLLNRVSLNTNKPLVSGAAIRTEGQVSVFNKTKSSPCYQCLYDDPSIQQDTNCTTNGVFAPLVGIIGSMQANEALKLISGFGSVLDGKLYVLDSNTMQSRILSFAQDKLCPHHN